MPYIRAEFRAGAEHNPCGPGELNFAITKLLVKYMQHKPISYSLLNEMVGALESAKAEFQRRVVGPYENQKIVENGDVYMN